jgi:multidrug efflux pump subunit AcrA (membrane-fusion protein)
MIPISAVVRSQRHNGAYAVFLVRQRAGAFFAETREITVGETWGNSIEVTGGLEAGDRVITMGGELLRDGQQVCVL